MHAKANRALTAAAAVASALALLGPAAARATPPLEMTVAGAAIRVQLNNTDFGHGDSMVLEWVRRSAATVAAYYGQFPTRRLQLALEAHSGDGVHGGKTFANPDAYIRVGLGREVTASQLQADWVLVHEMTHLALPDTGEEHAWLSEGLATYVEGVARVQSGNRSEADVWSEEVNSMPRGLPAAGDRGLDNTHTWGRTYWGGAMFCLLADVQIRQHTQNRMGLQDALRAILKGSGGLAADWPIERVLRTGDTAIGGTVLADLYARYKDAAVSPDLMALWKQLGVEPDGATVRLNDAAPLADVRHAIMRAPAANAP